MVKTLQKISSRTSWAIATKHEYVALRMQAHHSLFKLLPKVDLDLFYSKFKFGRLGLYMGKSENNIAGFDIKVGRFIELNVLMKLHKHRRSRPFLT